MRNQPELTFDTIKRMEDMTWFTHAQIFDDLLIVAQKETSCFVWKTSLGLVVIDGIWPDERVYDQIIAAIKEAGWENCAISKFVMTHGHIDHVGCGKWLKDNHNAETILSKADDELRLSTPSEEGRCDCWKEFGIDRYIEDGDTIDCGDKQIKVVATPGHTEGCMSYIFPIFYKEKAHMACLFGGATAPWGDENGKDIQKQSIMKFMKAAKENHCDVALANHTAFDAGIEKISYSKARLSYLPNIYVLGEEGVQKFCEVYITVAQ